MWLVPPVHPDADGDRGELRDGGVLLGEAGRARDLALPPLHLHHQHGHLRRLLHHHEDLPEVTDLTSLTGISSQIRTKLRDLAVRQARAD